MSTERKTIDEITRTKSTIDGAERLPGRDSSGDFKTLISSIYTYFKNTILDTNTSLGTSDNVAPTQKAVKNYVDGIVSGALTGAISIWPSEDVPAGYLECDGSAVNRTTYSTLFSAIGARYGKGDGSTTFNLPDLRGRFLRGFDNGAATDPDADDRTTPFTAWDDATCDTTNGDATITMDSTANIVKGMSVSGVGIPADAYVLSVTNTTTFELSANATADGTNVTLTFTLTGDHVGSEQLDQFQGWQPGGTNGGTLYYGFLENAGYNDTPNVAANYCEGRYNSTKQGDADGLYPKNDGTNGDPRTGTETRSLNTNMMFIIKY